MTQINDVPTLTKVVYSQEDWLARLADAGELTEYLSAFDQLKLLVSRMTVDPWPATVQTVIGTFESESLAQIAAHYLASLEPISSSALWVLAPNRIGRDDNDEPTQVADAFGDHPYWAPVQSALGANRAVLILMVDEGRMNWARAILADDTGSLQTAVLPRPPQNLPVVPLVEQDSISSPQ